MRNAMPLQWIEQAEARHVVAAALFERLATPSWSRMAQEAAAAWLSRAGARLALGDWVGGPLLQAQPALVRRPADRARRDGDDDGYSRDW